MSNGGEYWQIFLSVAILTILSYHVGVPDVKREIRYEIDNIEFKYTGAQTLDEGMLLAIMESPKNKYYKQEILAMDMKRLKKFYFDNGFFNAEVDTAVAYNNDDETAEITILIKENERYMINKIRYNGLENISEGLRSSLRKERVILPGEYYNRVKILNEENRIVGMLLNNGYLYAMVDTADGTTVIKNPTGESQFSHDVDIEINFKGADKVYYFGDTKVNIQKNIYNVKHALIIRELEYKKGDIYSKENIIQSERNFTKLAIIQSARIQIDTVLDEQRRLELSVRVSLSNKHELTPNVRGVDIQGQFYLGAGLQYIDKDVFGGGEVVSIELNLLAHSKDVYRTEINTTLFQPYFFNNNITATLNSKFYIINQPELQTTSVANLIRLNYFIAPYTFYQNVYGDLTVDELRQNYKQDAVVDGDSITAGTISNVMNSVIGFTLLHDNTNDVFQPSSGFYHSISAENAGFIPQLVSLFGSGINFSQYVKLYIPSKFYFDLSAGKGVRIFATKFIVGDIIEYGGGENIEPVASVYKFYSGGNTSLRGWSAKTNGILTDPELGGKFLIDGSFEYRWKLFYLSPGFMKNFWLVPFLDYGNVWGTAKDFEFNQIALATGFGFRYDTFAGPLRIDFGFKLYNPSAPEGSQWLFNSGGRIFKDKFAVQFGIGNAF